MISQSEQSIEAPTMDAPTITQETTQVEEEETEPIAEAEIKWDNLELWFRIASTIRRVDWILLS